MLHRGDEHFIASLNMGASVGVGDEVDAFGGAANKNDFVCVGGI